MVFAVMLACLAVGCDSGGGSGEESSSSSGGTEGTSESETTGETEGLDTETTGEDTENDTDTDTDTDTDGGEPLAECSTEDPELDASYAVSHENWDELETAGTVYAWYDVEEACTVESVEATDGNWVTRLDCGGEPARIATLTIAAPPTGAPDWTTGEPLTFDASANVDDFGGYERIRLLRGEDVLVHAVRGSALDGGEEGFVASLGAVHSTAECQAPELDDFDALDTGRLALHFGEGENTLAIISGHRGALALEDGRTLEIDVAEATSGNCCHSAIWLDVLMRVAIGE